MGFIAGMSAVWAGWLLFSGTFVGLGCVVLRFSTDPRAKWDIGTAFWSGFSVTIAILQVSNLFSAIGPRTTTALVGFRLRSLCLHFCLRAQPRVSALIFVHIPEEPGKLGKRRLIGRKNTGWKTFYRFASAFSCKLFAISWGVKF
jgi:hypothetical protein